MGVFLSFVVWSFSFYFSFFPSGPTAASEFVEIINDDINDFLFVESYSTPLRFNASSSTNETFNFTYFWPGNSIDSTRIFNRSSSSISCIISGDVVYFQSDTDAGYNYFTLTYTNQTMTRRCSGTFNTENASKIVPFVPEQVDLISQEKINEMTNQTYVDFKNNLSITRDFRIEINESGTETNFGPSLPKNRNIFVRETFTKMEESGLDTDIRVLVW